MEKPITLKWSFFGVEPVEFPVRTFSTLTEELDAGRVASETAYADAYNGQRHVIVRRMSAQDETEKQEDGSIVVTRPSLWGTKEEPRRPSPDELTSFYEAFVIEEAQRGRSAKPKVRKVTSAELDKMTKKEIRELLRSGATILDDGDDEEGGDDE